MNVKELIEELQQYEPEMEVCVAPAGRGAHVSKLFHIEIFEGVRHYSSYVHPCWFEESTQVKLSKMVREKVVCFKLEQ